MARPPGPEQKRRLLDIRAAVASPCQSCQSAPCCTYLPLDRFRVNALADIDYARYVLNFDRIEVGATRQGDWSVYLVGACRHLDASGRCVLHGTGDKPHVCSQYSSHNCWYRPALVTGTGDYVRVDRRRLEWILERTRFDERREIVELPGWDDLLEATAESPIGPLGTGLLTLPVINLATAGTAGSDRDVRSGAEHYDPCAGCSAYCCNSLVFPVGAPNTRSELDYLRFALGFPGVSVTVLDDAWALNVATTCRHLQSGRCSVYGQWERPLRCQNYDAWQCGYRAVFEPDERRPSVTFRLEQFDVVAGQIQYDDAGQALAVPHAADLAPVLAGTGAVSPALR